jgi:hypothetical protein
MELVWVERNDRIRSGIPAYHSLYLKPRHASWKAVDERKFGKIEQVEPMRGKGPQGTAGILFQK